MHMATIFLFKENDIKKKDEIIYDRVETEFLRRRCSLLPSVSPAGSQLLPSAQSLCRKRQFERIRLRPHSVHSPSAVLELTDWETLPRRHLSGASVEPRSSERVVGGFCFSSSVLDPAAGSGRGRDASMAHVLVRLLNPAHDPSRSFRTSHFSPPISVRHDVVSHYPNSATWQTGNSNRVTYFFSFSA